MEDAIEASSLSTLTNLFANPPQYPRNPTHEKHEPLILYIVRVPGSSDLFLTPVKPVKASISLEAVQHCLYYLHLDTNQDEDIRRSISEDHLSVNEKENAVTPVTRKPLPATRFADYPEQQRPQVPTKGYSHDQPSSAGSTDTPQLDRSQAQGPNLRLNTSEGNGVPPRKPAGPRPLRSNSLEDGYAIARKLVNQSPIEGRNSSDGSCLPRKPVAWSTGIFPISASQVNTGYGNHGQSTTQLSTGTSNMRDSSDLEGRLGHTNVDVTIIRRDPVSGSQWNVGRMSMPRSPFADRGVPAAHIQLTTPGYQRFRHDFDPEEGRAQLAQLKRLSPTEMPVGHAVDAEETRPTSRINELFERVVEFKPMIETMPVRSHQRSQSFDAMIATDRGSRYAYSFQSPWHGTCLFNTGPNGRTVRCRHMLSATTASNEAPSSSVAELRLNLPWLVLNNKDPNQQNVPGASDKLPIKHLLQPRGKAAIKQKMREIKHKSLSKLSGHQSEEHDQSMQDTHEDSNPQTFSDDEDVDERISLKLGREKAGGGFSGNDAKLGKLILEDEGLKMADLVVAACMSIFWQQYARELLA